MVPRMFTLEVAFHCTVTDISVVVLPVQGVPQKRPLPLTNPDTPAVALKRRRLHEDSDPSSEEVCQWAWLFQRDHACTVYSREIGHPWDILI